MELGADRNGSSEKCHRVTSPMLEHGRTRAQLAWSRP